jgi:cell division septation protein DedD
MSAMARSRRGAEPARPSRLGAIALGVAALAALGGSLWYLRPWGGGTVAPQEAPAAAVAPPPVDVAPPQPMPWTIELSRVNSPDGALLRVRQIVDSFPPATYSPVQPAQGGARWFRVVVGAFADSGEAVTFLDAMHQRRLAPESAGLAVRLPLALLVADSLTGAEAVQRATELRGQGLPAYTLPAAGGLARVYVGAFEAEEAAAPLMARLDSLNLRSTLVPRVGSVN